MRIEHWGALMKMARRAAALAQEEHRRSGRIKEQEESSILLYTDDPTAVGVFATQDDMAAICKASGIEGVCIVMGEKFPPDAHEAERDDAEMPRVAAMWFPPPGEKCPRCRNFTKPVDAPICRKCAITIHKDQTNEGWEQ